MTEPDREAAPRIVDRAYVLHEKLGEGGMGTVFSATARVGGRSVALKVIQREGTAGPGHESQTQLLVALAREFQTLSSLHHPNVIQVLEYGFDPDLGPYYTMELLPAPRDLLAAGIGKGLQAKVELLAQLLRALAYLHRRGIIHRDLKPSNVLCVGEQIKVVDFGLATTDPVQAEVAGTLDYMAPELFHGKPPSVLSDLFAVGMMAEQLLLEAPLRSDDSRRSLEQAVTVGIPDSVLMTGKAAARRDRSSALGAFEVAEPAQRSPQAFTMGSPEILAAASDTPSVVATAEPAERSVTVEYPTEGPALASPFVHTRPLETGLLGRLSARKRSPHARAAISIDHPLAPVITALTGIVDRLCAPNPEDRYASANDVLLALGRAVGADLPVETQDTRESFLQASEFVGREVELETLRSSLTAALRGEGGTWLIGGESGVGKSRLMSELRTLALVQGASVVQGQAVSEGGQAYDVWLPTLRALCMRADPPDADAAVLKELVPDLADVLGRPLPDAPRLPPPAAQARLRDVIVACFRRQPKPTVVLLEDLHWAKEDSLALFGRIAGLAAELPLLLVGTHREEEAPQLPASAPTARTMKLERLDKRNVAALSASMLGRAGEQPDLVDYLCRATEGNVFFLVEVVRALAEQAGRLDHIGSIPLPEQLSTGGIVRIARRRIDRVPSRDRALLEVAATFGRGLDLAVLEAMSPGVELGPWLAACADAAVLESYGNAWRFSHDKFREAILSMLSPERLRELHGRIARAICDVYAGADIDARSAALAHHFQQAGDHDEAAKHHARAGDIATRLCCYADARRHYNAALSALKELQETNAVRRRRVDVLLGLVYTTMVSDATEQNEARMSEATALLEAIAGEHGPSSAREQDEDVRRTARVNNVIGRIHLYGGRSREAMEYFRKVLAVADTTRDDELLALPSLLIGMALLTQGDMRRAEPLLAQASGPLERLGEPFEWFRAVGYHGFSLIALGRYRDGLADLERVHTRAREIGQPGLSAAAHLMRGTALTLASDWLRVVEDSQAVLELASQTGDKLHLSLAWSNLGWAHSALGRHEQAFESRAKAKELAQEMGGRLILSDWYDAADAELALNAGRRDAALALASTLAESSRAAGLFLCHGVAERVWGTVLAVAGETDAADAHMATSIHVLEGAGLVLPAARTRLCWALQRRDRGEGAAAQRLCDEARVTFAGSGCDYAVAEADRRWRAR